jgi:tetratricopeptide (TPR) repeat protein
MLRVKGLSSFWITVALALCSLSATAGIALAQANDLASQIYQKTSSSVFLIAVHDGKGLPISLGTAFLIGKNTLATNFHVVEGGDVFLEQGAMRIPATVEKRDPANDLAIIRVNVEISAKPLTLSEKSAVPGESIFAIGNPEGLEKSISTGVVAALREFNGRRLLQITAPISHGSSGGPILNATGAVVGVAVAMLKDGQNLNFAVPAEQILKLLTGTAPAANDLLTLFEKIDHLDEEQKQQQSSKDPDSDWQKTNRQINSILESALEQAGNSADLLVKIAERAKTEDWDITIEAAQRATRLKPSAKSNFLLGEALYLKGIFSEGAVKAGLLQRAEGALKKAIQMSTTLSEMPKPEMYNDLAWVLEARGSLLEATQDFRHALQIGRAIGDVEQQASSLRGLASTAYELGRPGEIDTWFSALVETGSASASDWQDQGSRLYKLKEYNEAGLSYRQAASSGGNWTNWCEAAKSFSRAQDQPDAVLASARECIKAGTGLKDSEESLANAHLNISWVLNKRGVFAEALSHAREASNLDPSDPFSLDAQADALFGLRRFQEAINASTQAIRLSDGKYAWMHFRQGSSYFEVENWNFAKQSFEKASQLDPSDTDAPYNVALCYGRLGYRADAAKWFQEVLRRNPNHPERADIQRRISALGSLQ